MQIKILDNPLKGETKFIEIWFASLFIKKWRDIIEKINLKSHLYWDILSKRLMRDAEVSSSKTCLLLENKKQNTFASENNLESIESTKKKGLESTKE